MRALALAALLTGCIPIPAVTPPARLSGGVGAAVGEETTGYANGRFGVAPLGLFPGERSFDGDLGVVLEGPLVEEAGDPRVGGYLGGAWYASQTMRGEKVANHRLALRANAELLDGTNGLGYGAVFSVGWEFYKHLTEPAVGVDDRGVPNFIGVYVGEAGVGVDLSAGYRDVGAEQYWLVTLDLVLRAPTALGLLLVPLFGDEAQEGHGHE